MSCDGDALHGVRGPVPQLHYVTPHDKQLAVPSLHFCHQHSHDVWMLPVNIILPVRRFASISQHCADFFVVHGTAMLQVVSGAGARHVPIKTAVLSSWPVGRVKAHLLHCVDGVILIFLQIFRVKITTALALKQWDVDAIRPMPGRLTCQQQRQHFRAGQGTEAPPIFRVGGDRGRRLVLSPVFFTNHQVRNDFRLLVLLRWEGDLPHIFHSQRAYLVGSHPGEETNQRRPRQLRVIFHVVSYQRSGLLFRQGAPGEGFQHVGCFCRRGRQLPGGPLWDKSVALGASQDPCNQMAVCDLFMGKCAVGCLALGQIVDSGVDGLQNVGIMEGDVTYTPAQHLIPQRLIFVRLAQ